MRFHALASAVGAAALLGATSLSAQTVTTSGCDGVSAVTCKLTNTASTTIPVLIELSLTGADPTPLTAPVVTDFDNTGLAVKDNTGVLAHVRSNTPWHVTVKGNSATFTGTGFAKSAADLTWAPQSTGTYANDMSANGTLMSGNATAGVDETILYRTNWHITTDSPGTYSLVVNFTVSAP